MKMLRKLLLVIQKYIKINRIIKLMPDLSNIPIDPTFIWEVKFNFLNSNFCVQGHVFKVSVKKHLILILSY